MSNLGRHLEAARRNGIELRSSEEAQLLRSILEESGMVTPLNEADYFHGRLAHIPGDSGIFLPHRNFEETDHDSIISRDMLFAGQGKSVQIHAKLRLSDDECTEEILGDTYPYGASERRDLFDIKLFKRQILSIRSQDDFQGVLDVDELKGFRDFFNTDLKIKLGWLAFAGAKFFNKAIGIYDGYGTTTCEYLMQDRHALMAAAAIGVVGVHGRNSMYQDNVLKIFDPTDIVGMEIPKNSSKYQWFVELPHRDIE